jgi:adenine-specific DNA glycosylase
VIDYFTRWMARWPTVEALAAASEEEVRASPRLRARRARRVRLTPRTAGLALGE